LGVASIACGRSGCGGTIAGGALTVLLSSILQVVGIALARQSVAYGVVILATLCCSPTARVPIIR